MDHPLQPKWWTDACQPDEAESDPREHVLTMTQAKLDEILARVMARAGKAARRESEALRTEIERTKALIHLHKKLIAAYQAL